MTFLLPRPVACEPVDNFLPDPEPDATLQYEDYSYIEDTCITMTYTCPSYLRKLKTIKVVLSFIYYITLKCPIFKKVLCNLIS